MQDEGEGERKWKLNSAQKENLLKRKRETEKIQTFLFRYFHDCNINPIL